MSEQLIQSTGDVVIRSLNNLVNQRIEELTRVVVGLIENTTSVEVKRIQMKFMEDINNNIVFLGVRDEIVYTLRR